MRKSRRQYQPGDRVEGILNLLVILDKKEAVFWRGKYYHPGWVRSWQLGMVLSYLDQGEIFRAVKINKETRDGQ